MSLGQCDPPTGRARCARQSKRTAEQANRRAIAPRPCEMRRASEIRRASWIGRASERWSAEQGFSPLPPRARKFGGCACRSLRPAPIRLALRTFGATLVGAALRSAPRLALVALRAPVLSGWCLLSPHFVRFVRPLPVPTEFETGRAWGRSRRIELPKAEIHRWGQKSAEVAKMARFVWKNAYLQ